MNNDITRDTNSYINSPVNIAGIEQHVQKEGENELSCDVLNEIDSSDIDMEKSMNCMLGKFQVDSNCVNRAQVKKSLDEFINNPGYIEAHNDFCDELVRVGYNLEDAVIKTDLVFEALKNGKIYN